MSIGEKVRQHLKTIEDHVQAIYDLFPSQTKESRENGVRRLTNLEVHEDEYGSNNHNHLETAEHNKIPEEYDPEQNIRSSPSPPQTQHKIKSRSSADSKRPQPRSLRVHKPKYTTEDLVNKKDFKRLGNGALAGTCWLKDETGKRTNRTKWMIIGKNAVSPNQNQNQNQNQNEEEKKSRLSPSFKGGRQDAGAQFQPQTQPNKQMQPRKRNNSRVSIVPEPSETSLSESELAEFRQVYSYR